MHLKRENSPKQWPIERKGTAYLARPSYSINSGVPILLVVRNILKFAKTRREVRKALNARQILLNNKEVFNENNNAVLFDIITIKAPKGSSLSEKHYRMVIRENKKFDAEEIPSSEAHRKVAKVINKKTLKGKKTQINLSDGRNFISEIKCKVDDSIVINLKNRKAEKVVPLKVNARVSVFAGKHAGKRGIIKEMEEKDKIARIESEGEKINILIKQLMVTE